MSGARARRRTGVATAVERPPPPPDVVGAGTRAQRPRFVVDVVTRRARRLPVVVDELARWRPVAPVDVELAPWLRAVIEGARVRCTRLVVDDATRE